MPLTLTNRVYKTLPGFLADKVTEKARRRADNNADATASPSSPQRGALRPRQSPTPTSSMTKRSNTPLATISDGEESENSSTAPTPTTRRESPSPCPPGRRESPSPCPRDSSGLFHNAFNVIPRLPRVSSRTTVSLDNVDLWEDVSDNEGSDAEFDEINGITINPCKTFDFSELRRSRSPVACKRNKLLHDDEHDEGEESDVVNDKSVFSLERISPRVSPGRASPRISPGRTSPRVSTGRVSPRISPRVSPGRVSPGRISPREIRLLKPRARIARRSKPTNESKTGKDAILPKEPHNAKTVHNLSETKTITATRTSPPSRIPKSANLLSKRNVLERSSTNFALYKLKEEAMSIEKDSLSDCESMSPSGERRVKFNNFVTVRDGESNTVDKLRHSNNSAQLYKKQFLPSFEDDDDPPRWTLQFNMS